ncbi:MAG: Cof-type HAD-IIB family hydrolase [Coriobacteriales bacterium]|jgi:hydroxymethylpyrimidine pyrophosphatase-like HAD family hydrolase|nr:Cof-type HAD-IIB family hydrolase [Coriobacteriales bacterium]
MGKLVVFDVDGTLAPIGEALFPVAQEWLATVHKNTTVALASGKPLAYLCGLCRAHGLKDLVLIGENGAQLQWGYDFPPRRHESLPFDPTLINSLKAISAAIKHRFGDTVWFQPNQVTASPFFADAEVREELKAFIGSQVKEEDGVQVFEHVDCFDLCPRGLDKGAALRYLREKDGFAVSDIAAVGDGSNDVPMFAEAGYSIGLVESGDATFDYPVDVACRSLKEALAFVDTWMYG